MPDALADALLVTIVMLPAATALLLVGSGLVLGFLGLPALPERGWRMVGIAASTLTFLLAFGVLALGFDPERIGFQHVEFFGWPGTYGAHLLLGVDGIGLCFLVVTSGLVPLAMLCSEPERREGTRSWVATCLLLESGLLGGLGLTLRTGDVGQEFQLIVTLTGSGGWQTWDTFDFVVEEQ